MHMNSHSRMKRKGDNIARDCVLGLTEMIDFWCPVESCNKSFAVHSNAERHLRTHGINPAAETTSETLEYVVGSETPTVPDVRQASQVPVMLKWVPQSLTSRTSVAWNNKSSDSESDGEDNYPSLSVPPSPATPSSLAWDCDYSSGEETYDGGDNHPYHPRHVRNLPDATGGHVDR